MNSAIFNTVILFGGIILFFVLLGGVNTAAGDELTALIEMVKDAWNTFTGLGDALSNAEREFDTIGK